MEIVIVNPKYQRPLNKSHLVQLCWSEIRSLTDKTSKLTYSLHDFETEEVHDMNTIRCAACGYQRNIGDSFVRQHMGKTLECIVCGKMMTIINYNSWSYKS